MTNSLNFVGLAICVAFLVSCGEAKKETRSDDIVVNLENLAEYNIEWAKIGSDVDYADCVLRTGRLDIGSKHKGFIEFEYRDCSSSELEYTTVFSHKQIPMPFQVNSKSNYDDADWTFFTGLTSIKNRVENRISQKQHFEATRFLLGVTVEQADSYFNSLPDYCYSQVLPANNFANQNIPDANMKVWQVFNHNKKQYPKKPQNASEIQMSRWSDEVAEIDRYNYSCEESAIYVHQNEVLFFVDYPSVVFIPSFRMYRL